MRLQIDLAYDGSDFHGWATQPGLRTVQGELEQALRTILRLEAAPVTCAGRTDTGVHARGQVTHLDLPEDSLAAVAGRSADPAEEVLLRRLNGLLPADVRVRGVRRAAEGFDARFSALWRRYSYRIVDSPDRVDPLTRNHVLAWPRPLDVEAMQVASAALLGEHDFAAFCRRREGATTLRTLLDLEWQRRSDGVVEVLVRADAFCHHMVRSLVGCLLAVGDGRRPVEWPAEVLSAQGRNPSVTVVQPHGLTLEEVAYPADDGLAARAETTRTVRTRG